MSGKEIIGICAICGKPIYKGEEYQEIGFIKKAPAHKLCVQLKQLKAMAEYARVRARLYGTY